MERHLLACGIPAHKLVQVSNWADGKRLWSIERQENTFLAEHQLQDRFVVMYSGNLGAVHEFATIAAVIQGLRSEKQICFCFIGEGCQKQRLVEAAQREGWENVLFLPYQTKEALRFSLTAGDVHLVSLRPDMAGLSVPSKLYGILAVGRPVIFIGPEESEVARVIRDGNCGYVIRPGDVQSAMQALLACYHDRIPLKQRGQAAQAHFQRFYDRPVATEKFWRLLQRITA
jgi:glycosyltransferase involved in cell wall biosynthesis